MCGGGEQSVTDLLGRDDQGHVLRPHPTRLALTTAGYEDIIAAHEVAVVSGAPAYNDPASGLVVLTVVSHLRRGTCCGSGCRHCPYVESEFA